MNFPKPEKKNESETQFSVASQVDYSSWHLPGISDSKQVPGRRGRGQAARVPSPLAPLIDMNPGLGIFISNQSFLGVLPQ